VTQHPSLTLHPRPSTLYRTNTCIISFHLSQDQLLAAFDRAAIAERLRGLLGTQNRNDIEQIAARLGVEELSLRMSIDETSPHPTVEVLAAVIREHGVDPNWLLTGTYDASTHRAAIEHDGVASALRQFSADVTTHRIAEPPPEDLHGNPPI
jgi:hypothetical protein